VRAVAVAAAAVLLAGCNGGGEDEDAAPATTATQTVTVREPTPAETAPAPDRAGSLAEAVETVLPSVVTVRTTSFGGGEGEASGVVLRREGLILTNNHVVEGTTGVTVAFNDEVHTTPLEGDVIGTAPERDLAVIRVDADDLVPIELARSSALRLGDVVIAIGFPANLGGPTVTSGIVSGLDRTIEGPNGDLTGLLQTDAAINPGNSGGPLVDRSGRLVGINTAGIRSADTENIGFAIAIDEALPVIAEISDAPPTTEAWLGISFSSVDSESAAVQLGLDSSTRGAAVTNVYPGGPGAKADLQVGDVIIAADDVPIRNANALAKLIAERKIGDELDLELIDSRGPRLATVKLARRTPGALP
jgi:S1-C subfamily serine protease